MARENIEKNKKGFVRFLPLNKQGKTNKINKGFF